MDKEKFWDGSGSFIVSDLFLRFLEGYLKKGKMLEVNDGIGIYIN